MTVNAVELEQQAQRLADEGHSLVAARWHSRAVGRFKEALAIASRLAERHPEDLRHAQMAGSLLYTLGQLYIAVGRFPDAASAFGDAARWYSTLSDGGMAPDVVGPLYGDIRAHHGLANAMLGQGTSAILRLDLAVQCHRLNQAGSEADLARVLGINAYVLGCCGDPELAGASARESLRYHSLAEAAGQGTESQYRDMAEQVLQAASEETATVSLSAALEAAAVLMRDDQWVYRHVERAVELLSRRGRPSPVVCPSDRCLPSDLLDTAAALARVGFMCMEHRPEIGFRLSYEAHVLFAAAHWNEDQRLHARAGKFGMLWALALTSCSEVYRAEDNIEALAQDVSIWLQTVIDFLKPHSGEISVPGLIPSFEGAKSELAHVRAALGA